MADENKMKEALQQIKALESLVQDYQNCTLAAGMTAGRQWAKIMDLEAEIVRLKEGGA